MGMMPRRFSDGETSSPTPDPFRFEIEERKDYGRYSVVTVRYPDCTTFRGLKILVVRDLPLKPLELDPHFLESNSVIARLRPTYQGHEAAHKLAKMLKSI